MRLQRNFLAALLTLSLGASVARGDLVALEDFDGGSVRVISSNVPTLDGGGGDTFAVGATEAWPTAGGTPFSIADNSVGDVGDTTFFAGDAEGIYGVNSSFTNRFIGAGDTREFDAGDLVATFQFDISGFSDLTLSIDMGSMEGSTFAYDDATEFLFTYSIDGGSTLTAFDVGADDTGAGYAYRPLDDGTVIVADPNVLSVTGDSAVTKILADTGLAAADTILDKTPASGAGAGRLDTFRTNLSGTGSVLTLTMTTNIPFEAAAFDNFRVDGVTAVPEPGSMAAVAAVGLAGLRLRRRKKTV